MPKLELSNPKLDYCTVKNNTIAGLKRNNTVMTVPEITFVNNSNCTSPCKSILLPEIMRPNTTYTFQVSQLVHANLTHFSPEMTFKIGKCKNFSTNITSLQNETVYLELD